MTAEKEKDYNPLLVLIEKLDVAMKANIDLKVSMGASQEDNPILMIPPGTPEPVANSIIAHHNLWGAYKEVRESLLEKANAYDLQSSAGNLAGSISTTS